MINISWRFDLCGGGAVRGWDLLLGDHESVETTRVGESVASHEATDLPKGNRSSNASLITNPQMS